MNSDLFKEAAETARSLHRTTLLTSLVLIAFLIPNAIDGSSSLQRTLAAATSVHRLYNERGYNDPLRYVEGTTPFILDISGRQDLLNPFSRYVSQSFEFDAGQNRKLFNTILPTSFRRRADDEFVYSKEIKELLFLYTRSWDDSENQVDKIIKDRLLPINAFVKLPPHSSFGAIRPRWLSNVVDAIPHNVSTMSDAMRLLYIVSKMESVTFLSPNYSKAKITIYEKNPEREVAIQGIDFEHEGNGLPLKCDTKQRVRVCGFQFEGYEILVQGSSSYEVKSRIDNDRFSVHFSAPADSTVITIDKNWCNFIAKTECSSLIDTEEAVGFIRKYGDLPLDSVMNVFRAVHQAGQSLQIVGVSIVGLRWICLLGTWILAVICCSLVISLRTVQKGLLTNELKTYAEILPSTKPGALLAVSSLILLPCGAVVLGVATLFADGLGVILFSALAAILTVAACVYCSTIVLNVHRRLISLIDPDSLKKELRGRRLMRLCSQADRLQTDSEL